ncbi:polyribonucleotide 5'-hydroxyl-kinase Clp1-like [Mytilus trossulus]|uniref:polyribonucleotide 5'-hydroxyl-kinase Clp1-like n=1 Tax=Mytilus trossulus TaxID=6551 RepID=UPI003006AED8
MSEEKKEEEYRLEKDQELRFEVEARATASLELLDGMAEIFGTELTKGKKYLFESCSKVAVYTWHSCVVKLEGRTEVAYIADGTPMTVYVNVHAALEQMRQKADEERSRGPRVMVVGPTDVGKSTLCRLLLNYAARLDRASVYVDLDVGQGEVSIPGTIGAAVVERPAEIEEGYSLNAPLVFHYGHTSPSSNYPLFKMLVSRMAECVNKKTEKSKKCNVSGCIINTGGWIKGAGYDSLKHIAGSFEVDVILVLGQERLYSELKRDMPDFVNVILLPKSGGVVERNQHQRSDFRDQKVREYFYGPKKNGDDSFFPHPTEVSYNDIKLYKIGAPALPDSMLPLGMKKEDNKTKLVPLQPGTNILHHVFSVSTAKSIEDAVLECNVYGHVVISGIDPDKQTATVLSPSPEKLPSSILLLMDMQFMDIDI